MVIYFLSYTDLSWAFLAYFPKVCLGDLQALCVSESLPAF